MTSIAISSIKPVVDENSIADVHVVGEMIVRDRDLAFAFETFVHENEILALLDVDRAGDVAHANARALQVAKDGDRTIELFRDAANHLDRLGVLRMRAVREVEAGDVHARIDQPADALIGRARGTKRADDLGARDVRGAHLAAVSALIFVSIPAVRESNDFWKLASPSVRSLSVTSFIEMPTASISRSRPSAAPRRLSTVR